MLQALENLPGESFVLSNGTQHLSVSETHTLIAAWADQLNGIRVLAVLADNSIDWVIADLAALDANLVHLPIPNFFSPSQTVHVLQQTGADAVLTDQCESVIALGLGFVVERALGALTLLRRSVTAVALPGGTAKISFTSGSTGTPKGVCLSAAGLMDTATSISYQLAPLSIQRHLAVLPLTLLLENTAGVYAGLISGACVMVPSLAQLGWRGMAGFNPAALQQAVQTLTPHSVILVPELLKAWALFLAATAQPASAILRFVAVGGARVDPQLLQRSRQLGIPAYEGYGMTECGSVVSINRPGDEGSGVGRPLPHVQLQIDDGEIQLQTRAFLGYVTLASETPASIAADQSFPSGDLGSLDSQGHLHLTGRRKNLIITSFGRNISPEWVESVFLAEAPIAQVVVMGEAQAALGAVIVPFPGVSAAQIEAAVARANASLPDYARIGAWIQSEPFTLHNALATGNGRPVRATIAARYAQALSTIMATQHNHEEIRDVVL